MTINASGTRSKTVLKLLLVNIAILVAMLVPVELLFGTWVRPVGMRDLRRFSIPIDVRFEFDTKALYPSDDGRATYTRDQFGLRGSFSSLESIDVLTTGGSTTDQRYVDDHATWQAVAQARLLATGRKVEIANAGVDGQSTVGMAFNIDHWFPLLPGLHPKVILFYVGANDVLRRQGRDAYDRAVDPSSWRFRSAVYQLFTTVRSNLRAREVGVAHGRMPEGTASMFTSKGLLSESAQAEMAKTIADGFIVNIEGLRVRVEKAGARPIFMTQTAYAWNGDRHPPRGVNAPLTLMGQTVNYADVAAFHQELNRRLLEYCASHAVTCFDLANDVTFDTDDYYDFLHHTPRGAEKIGTYLAERLAQSGALPPPSR